MPHPEAQESLLPTTHTRTTIPHHLLKYWLARHTLFSRFSSGILLPDALYYGVTPESIALKISSHLSSVTSPKKRVLIDAFAGAGGNTIAFASSGRWDRIIAIEKDDVTLTCAQNNARVYRVEDRVEWVGGDCFDVVRELVGRDASREEAVVIFGSPPWGGPQYVKQKIFDLEKMEPYSLRELVEGLGGGDLVLYLPRTTDLRQIAELVPKEKKVKVVHYCMSGRSKAMCVYLGDFEYGNVEW
ncbi:trimethylguanosine synthase [Piedraia hortae CBS 480.64]|uniref:Trimethylguanosine synthase n=1 Tax=Piedraia hortae CBS 480.64 TaxID=1314780 RepID=A0A6A7BW09_9PEZI|nr:trimethylguanosine synthase [Piedraia hortae CBS 480.64]